jgi:hypothetical protein
MLGPERVAQPREGFGRNGFDYDLDLSAAGKAHRLPPQILDVGMVDSRRGPQVDIQTPGTDDSRCRGSPT